MTTRTDNFNRADESPIGAPWASFIGGGAILSSNALTSSGGTERISYYSDTWGADQESWGTVGNLSSFTNYAEIGVRLDSNGNGFVVVTDGASGVGHTEFGRFDNGAYTVLGGIATTFANGDRLRLTVSGTSGSITLTAYKDTGSGWVQVGQITGQTGPNSGAPGAGAYGLATVDNWSATDGQAAAAVDAGKRFRPGLHPAAGPFNPAQFVPRRGSRDNPATGGGVVSTDVAGRVRIGGAAGSSKIGATDILARVAVRGAEAANKIGEGAGSGRIAVGASQASAKFGSVGATGLIAVRAASSYSVGGIPSTDISVALRIVGSSTAVKLGTSDQSVRLPVRGVAAGAKIGVGSAAARVAIRASSSFAPPGVGSTDLSALLQIRASSTAMKLGATTVFGRVAVRFAQGAVIVHGSLATGRPTSTGTRRPRATGGTRPRNTQ